jgi:hypothetical protein
MAIGHYDIELSVRSGDAPSRDWLFNACMEQLTHWHDFAGEFDETMRDHFEVQ